MTGVTECRLMAHLVAGYPDMDTSRRCALALAAGGADYLEVQFPFSDPPADGPVIERACHASLAAGFRVEDGFRMVEELRDELEIPVFIMTYGSPVLARGVERFVRRAVEAGARGLIVPDIPPDSPEGLLEAGKAAGLAVVPVIAPGISDERLEMIRRLAPEYVYTALRLGVTGGGTELDAGTTAYLGAVAGLGAKVIAGFGVRSREQMLALSGWAHAAAVGSFFVERLRGALDGGNDVESALSAAARELTGR